MNTESSFGTYPEKVWVLRWNRVEEALFLMAFPECNKVLVKFGEKPEILEIESIFREEAACYANGAKKQQEIAEAAMQQAALYSKRAIECLERRNVNSQET